MAADKDNVQCDIKVVNAYKSYGKKYIINGLNMFVESGTIYGLLGASGCGKSTLLQCILGTIPIDSGYIDLKAYSVADIGYMPQNLCLEHLLTIKEMIEYYGTLYNMNKKQIYCRTEELSKFLQLPDANRFIKDLSGGQGRRVSLAISILHNPKIIILDEPTVGIDPLLRQEIWEEFSRMVKQQKKTIIITTHYIEEASKADRIGLMRNGVLIEEGSPQHILDKYETDTLESAFLTLCCKRDANAIDHKGVTNIPVKQTVETQSKRIQKSGKKVDSARVKALVKKYMNVFSRDYLLFFTIIILPTFQTFNLCLGVGVNVKDMQIAVKNDEINYSDCNHTQVSGCIFNENHNQTMSCVMMNYFTSQDYKLVEVIDRDAGELMIKNHQSVAFLHFPHNFTEDLVKFAGANHLSYNFESPVYVHHDTDNSVLKNQFLRDVTDSMKHLIETALRRCSYETKALGLPLEVNVVVGKQVKSYLNSFVTLFIAILVFYSPSILSLSLMLSERMDGILGRSMFAGVTILEVLISLFCVSTLFILAQMAITTFESYVIFSNPILITSGMFMYFAVMLFLGWIGFLYGILVAGIMPTKLGGLYAITGLSMSQFLLSGFVWPIEGQTPWLRSISSVLPVRIAGDTMNNIALKGLTWDNPSVLYGTAITFVQLILLVLLLIGLGKIKKDMWVLNK